MSLSQPQHGFETDEEGEAVMRERELEARQAGPTSTRPSRKPAAPAAIPAVEASAGADAPHRAAAPCVASGSDYKKASEQHHVRSCFLESSSGMC